MTPDSFDREITKALNETVDRASPEFTGSVISDLGTRGDLASRGGSRSFVMRPLLAAAAAVVLFVLGVTLGARVQTWRSGSYELALEEVTEREQMLREYIQLQQELDRVRQLASESSPVLYLGGDETFDVLYDLGEYGRQSNNPDIRPASLSTDG